MLDRGRRRRRGDPYEPARWIAIGLGILAVAGIALVGLRIGYVAGRTAGLPPWPSGFVVAAGCLGVAFVTAWVIGRR